jgi:hypothetical protein
MEPLTPNTAAILEYLSANMPASDAPNGFPAPITKDMPDSLPPSAFFNVPTTGLETPDRTPESSLGASASPEERKPDVHEAASNGSRRKSSVAAGAGALNKRKAGHGHTVQQSSEEDDGELSATLLTSGADGSVRL